MRLFRLTAGSQVCRMSQVECFLRLAVVNARTWFSDKPPRGEILLPDVFRTTDTGHAGDIHINNPDKFGNTGLLQQGAQGTD